MATKNIEDLCRICVQESHAYKHIYSHCIEDAYLYEVINALCHLDICGSDGLPEYICNDCYDKVLSFHKFQKTCHDGKAALISIKMKYSQEMAIDPSKIKTEVFMDEIEYDGYACSDRESELHESQTNVDADGNVPEGQLEAAEERSGLEEEDGQRASRERSVAVEESYKTGTREGTGIIPVGLVKCPREEPMAEEVPILRMPGRSSSRETKEVGGKAISEGKDRLRTKAPSQQPGSILPNEVEGYQIGGVGPAFLQRSSGDFLSLPEHQSRTLLNPCDQPFIDRGEGFTIKRIYNGTEEAFGDGQKDMGSFPFMGRANEKSRTGYKCPHCGKSISRRFDFESHLRIHSGIKPFECHICHATFNLKKRLKAHMNVHSAMKLFICAYCQRKFKSKDALRLHIYVHMGEKLPERPSKPTEVWCEICGVSVLESCLAYHMHTHTKDLDCQVCGETCRDAEDLNTHKRIHDHEKKFQCTKCGKRYGLKGNLAQHMMIHTNDKRFACNTCGRKFYTGSRLRRHEQVHSSERNVVCSICGRGFKTKYYLHQHLKTHQGGEAPFKCLTCGQRYKWQGDLKKHCRVKNHQN